MRRREGAAVWTQKDQVQAYQFLRRRLVSALVAGDANHPVSPSRRLLLGTVLGIAVALLVTAVFGIIGVLSPARAAEWKQGGQVIVEKETGARFVLGEGDLLHPVLNFASARLLAGGNGDRTVTVPAKTLADLPRGATVGIAGAPDSLPETGRLLGGPWTTCSRGSADLPANVEPGSSVSVGRAPGGRELRAGEGLLVRLASGERFLLTGGHRFKLADERAVVALGYEPVRALPVARNWLNTVPVGRDLAVVPLRQAGSPGPRLGTVDTRVGQVLQAEGVADGFYVVRADGVAPVTETEARLVLAAPGNAAAYPDRRARVLAVPAAELAEAPRAESPGEREPTGYPLRRPEPVSLGGLPGTVCASDFGATGAKLTYGDAAVSPSTVDDQGRVADVALVPGGAGALVADQPAPGASSGAVYLVTDAGVKFPVAGAESVQALGYGAVARRPVPAGVLALLRTGPVLDRAKAQEVVAR
ncbi:type VII secretion protein EccB [Crossiella sp. CA-258035]|uniref:type VII secretion protein EccB n=1 Tax=Crossiella sp. CA-258035 TaxID=2981138 RepID=UPI0024BCA17A|nr:type VII secretion protein EccB [Crossiella sp. CA-258035]WHT15886.1 type VII secretion protein EccB [Crossiella sp. CA-258035]